MMKMEGCYGVVLVNGRRFSAGGAGLLEEEDSNRRRDFHSLDLIKTT